MSCDFSTLSKVQGDPEQAMDLLQQCTDALTDPTMWYWTIAFTIVCALVGALIGKYKNAVVRDTLLGVALGPIGWIISLLLPAVKAKPACPACKRVVDASDRHCRYCGAALDSTGLR